MFSLVLYVFVAVVMDVFIISNITLLLASHNEMIMVSRNGIEWIVQYSLVLLGILRYGAIVSKDTK